ncbi:hypothetical protein OUZ56_003358 [Daphnia magna]|uniref:Uncharacterized protein n=1 Tax=Daphnia magna TaxID=35525 RepID=A0ABR0A8L7_9CRUS|nr:hypothetical protein OUZ56_003358 [Daphnia magna]
METPVEGERNDVRVELIEAEPAEFIPPEYSRQSSAAVPSIPGSEALSLIHSLFFTELSHKSEALLPPYPLACPPPAVTCQPATEPDPRSLHFTATKMSDNIRSPAEDTVYRPFERALENNNLHWLWVGLDRVVPREVFRRLGLREPFPRPTSALSKPKTTPTARFAPYARPADQDLKFLNEKERAELEAVQKVKEEHSLAILIANCKEKGAAETALYLQQTCLLWREKEALVQREEDLAKSSAARRLAAKAPEPYVPSPIVRPAVLQIQALPDIPSQTGPSTSAPDALLITPGRSSKSAKSSKSRSSSTRSRKETPGETPRSSKESRGRTSSSEKVLAKQFKKHGIHTSEDEEAALKSPTSPYSA